MLKRRSIIATAILLPSVRSFGQAAPAPKFEVASIKPSDAAPGSSGINTGNGLLRAYNVTVKRCMIGAYGVPDAQIFGGPKWIDEIRYDIVAKADYPAGDAELSVMLQTLLADRFKLSVHREQHVMSGYALTVAKGGLKALPSDPAVNATTNTTRGRIEAKGCPMSKLAARLSSLIGVMIVDKTEDPRNFDISLQWVPDDPSAKPGVMTGAPDGPSLFTALQEQLGLALEARKLPTEVLVIDHVEPPSEN